MNDLIGGGAWLAIAVVLFIFRKPIAKYFAKRQRESPVGWGESYATKTTPGMMALIAILCALSGFALLLNGLGVIDLPNH